MAKKDLLYGDIARVKRSIKHWVDDILNPLKKGDEILNPRGSLIWKNAGEFLKVGSDHCDLCLSYSQQDNECADCPYLKHYGYKCYASDFDLNCPTEINEDGEEITIKGHYTIFCDNPTLENAQAMVDSLKAIIKN